MRQVAVEPSVLAQADRRCWTAAAVLADVVAVVAVARAAFGCLAAVGVLEIVNVAIHVHIQQLDQKAEQAGLPKAAWERLASGCY